VVDACLAYKMFWVDTHSHKMQNLTLKKKKKKKRKEKKRKETGNEAQSSIFCNSNILLKKFYSTHWLPLLLNFPTLCVPENEPFMKVWGLPFSFSLHVLSSFTSMVNSWK
jgi:hypothetical protein